MYKRKRAITSLFFFVLMTISVISTPIMMSVRNITDMEFFFRVQRDREMSFAGAK